MSIKNKIFDFILNKIRILKSDSNYLIDKNILFSDFFQVLFRRSNQIFRGIFLKLFIGKSNGLLFLGKNVTIHHKSHLFVGKNLILGDNVFIDALSKKNICIGNNVTIQRDCILVCTGVIKNIGEGISIGNGCGINARVYLGGQGGITLGDNVIIGPDVKVFSENHIFSALNIPIKNQGESRKGVRIESNCWIGGGSIILDGVKIGEGSIVAAGAVVTKSFPRNSIIAGVPAKIIKNRLDD